MAPELAQLLQGVGNKFSDGCPERFLLTLGLATGVLIDISKELGNSIEQIRDALHQVADAFVPCIKDTFPVDTADKVGGDVVQAFGNSIQ